MTQLLQRAFEQAAALPEDKQDEFAQLALDDLESDEKWDALFADPRSEKALEMLAAQAMEAERQEQLEMWEDLRKQEHPMFSSAAKRLGEPLQGIVSRIENGEEVTREQLILTGALTDTFSHLLSIYGYLLRQGAEEGKS